MIELCAITHGTSVLGDGLFDEHGASVPTTVKRLADHSRIEPLSAPAIVTVAFDN